MTGIKAFLHLTRREWLLLSLIFLVWRVGLGLVGYLASGWLEYQPSFPYATSLLPSYGWPQWLYSWANFDGVHYLTIVDKGYVGTGLIQAFFPGYPALAWLIKLWMSNTLLSLLLVSNLAAYGLLLVWFGWLKMEASKRTAWIGTLALLFFPTSFFLVAAYGESLFLLFLMISFLAARRGMWWLAGLSALAASATRIVGIVIVPALLFELWQQVRDSRQPKLAPLAALKQVITVYTTSVVWIMAGSLGLLGYMLYLYIEFADPLFFLHVQAEFGAGRQEQLVLYPQVVWRYIKILSTYQPHDLKYIALVQEAVVGIGGLFMIGMSWLRTRGSYWLFSLGVFLVPTLTGTFSSMPRYILPCLVIWLVVAQQLARVKAWVLGLYLICSACLLLFNLILFMQGYWVA